MYRAPENTNRVKSIKSRFENVENQNITAKHEGPRSNVLGQRKGESNHKLTQNLSRQLSDPAKKNIKRTPAFRIERNSEKNIVFERNTPCNRSFYFERIQQYNTALKNIDGNNKKHVTTNENIQNKLNVVINEQKSKEKQLKPLLIKSKSSLDFTLIRSKFEGNRIDTKILDQIITNGHPEREEAIINNNIATITNPKEEKTVNNDDDIIPIQISCLYAKPLKPVPKALTQCHKVQTEPAKPSEKDQQPTDASAPLTDTLKAALKRPLPNGPAPQKPPRTFEHATPVKSDNKNVSFLHPNRRKQQAEADTATLKSEHIHDPRYKLNKLETALRNKLKTRKAAKTETSTTSGEDSDDSVLYKSKTHNRLPPLPKLPNAQSSSLNFNCFNGLTTTYEAIKEPNSNFFVSCLPEPVYAEPFTEEAIRNLKNGQTQSLYYMSTSLLCDEESNGCLNMDDSGNQQVSGDGSSMSSVTSESDVAVTLTPPIYDTDSPTTNQKLKIKQLIDTFESQQSPRASKKDAPDGAHRVEELKLSLQKTLERCFDSETKDSGDERPTKEPSTLVDSMINKFQTYVKTMPKYQKPKLSKDDRLFYCCLLVGWDSDKSRIMFKYPPNVKIPDNIEDLCYPEAASGPLDISNNAQCYSLVITNSKGERTFGYCRRVLPEGSTRCIPLAYCLLSKHRAPRFYKKILMELESRHGIPDKSRDDLISKFYHNKFPMPGQSVKIDPSNLLGGSSSATRRRAAVNDCDLRSFVHVNANGGYGTLNETRKTSNFGDVLASEADLTDSENNRELELTLTLHHDTRYEESDLKPLHTLPAHILLKIFASLLLERKVILISCVISTLSSCVDSLQSILYPFSWPHTFIPILPESLWDVVESPTPVICGILSVAVTNDHKIEHGIVVDLDARTIISEEGDEDSILSGSMKKAWNEGIALANTVPPDDYVHSVYLSDAYVKVFIVALKHYKNHIIDNSFEKESFIQNAKTKGIRRFLRWFTETTMFTAFIDSVIVNPQTFSLFDKKIEMYGSDGSSMILSKLREWKKS